MVTKKDKASAETTDAPAELNADDYYEGKPLPPSLDPSFHVEEWPDVYHEGFDEDGNPVPPTDPEAPIDQSADPPETKSY